MPRDFSSEAEVATQPRTAVGRLLAEGKARIPDETCWWRGQGTQGSGQYCAILAVDGPDQDSVIRAHWMLCRAMGFTDRSLARVYEYNDAPTTTLADLHACFDRAIALAEEHAND